MSIKSISSTLKEEKERHQQNDNHNTNNNDNFNFEHKQKRNSSMMSTNGIDKTINNKRFKTSQNNKIVETSSSSSTTSSPLHQTLKSKKGLLSTALNQLRESSKPTHVTNNDAVSHHDIASVNQNKHVELTKKQNNSKAVVSNTKTLLKSATTTGTTSVTAIMDVNNPYTNQRTIYIEG